MSSNPADEKGDLKNIYKVGLNTTRLVYVLGDLTVAWLLLRGAEVALEKLGGEVSAADKSFYEGKVAAATFFARNVLPRPRRRAGDRREHRRLDHGARRVRVLVSAVHDEGPHHAVGAFVVPDPFG